MNRVFIRATYISCLLFVMPCVAYAESKLTIAPGVMNFDYVETDVDGTFLDGEKGNILGIHIGLDVQTKELLTLGIAFEHYSGDVDYDGHIQSSDPAYNGLPLASKTYQNITSIAGSLRHSLSSHPPLSMYGAFTVKRWERDIQSTSVSGVDNFGNPFQNLSVSGLFEVYEWWQLTFGLYYKLSISPKSYIKLNGGLLRTINPTMKVSTSTLNLEEKWGFEAGVAWMYKLAQKHSLGVGGDYTYWEFGQSNVVFDSGLNGFILEPDSESKMFVLQLIYEYALN